MCLRGVKQFKFTTVWKEQGRTGTVLLIVILVLLNTEEGRVRLVGGSVCTYLWHISLPYGNTYTKLSVKRSPIRVYVYNIKLRKILEWHSKSSIKNSIKPVKLQYVKAEMNPSESSQNSRSIVILHVFVGSGWDFNFYVTCIFCFKNLVNVGMRSETKSEFQYFFACSNCGNWW